MTQKIRIFLLSLIPDLFIAASIFVLVLVSGGLASIAEALFDGSVKQSLWDTLWMGLVLSFLVFWLYLVIGGLLTFLFPVGSIIAFYFDMNGLMVFCGVAVYLPWVWVSYHVKQQDIFLQNFSYPKWLGTRFSALYPDLSAQDRGLVFKALKQYFLFRQETGENLAMPSRIVDDMWHEFILNTKAYDWFCKNAFGTFFHHVPAEAMSSPTEAQDGIRQIWFAACHHEDIDIKTPGHLPLLFDIDNRLGVKGGFHYALDCLESLADGKKYCASHIAPAGCGGSGCGGGCSGGCGGGCGGG